MTINLNDITSEFLSSDFKEDIEVFLKLTSEDINILIHNLMDINADVNSEETLKLVEILEDSLSTKCSKEQIMGILRLVHLLTFILVKVDDIHVDDIVENILGLDIVEENQKKLLSAHISKINENITFEIKRIILAISNNSFFPRLIDIKYSTAIKAIEDNDEIKYYLPIASIQISVKDDSREKIYFQATGRDISKIIEKLEKIQDTLIILEESSKKL